MLLKIKLIVKEAGSVNILHSKAGHPVTAAPYSINSENAATERV
jgi:hypothetical protein